jgi:hypothetical protein
MRLSSLWRPHPIATTARERISAARLFASRHDSHDSHDSRGRPPGPQPKFEQESPLKKSRSGDAPLQFWAGWSLVLLRAKSFTRIHTNLARRAWPIWPGCEYQSEGVNSRPGDMTRTEDVTNEGEVTTAGLPVVAEGCE